MFQLKITLILVVYLIHQSCCQLNCNYYELMEVNRNYTIASPGYENNQGAPRNIKCQWSMEAPPGYQVALDCDVVFLMPLIGCTNKLLISLNGRVDMEDADTYCGFGAIKTHSLSTRMKMKRKKKIVFFRLFCQ